MKNGDDCLPRMLKKASRAGHVKAQARLAKLLWFGGIGVDRKREQANDLAKSALRHPAELTTAQVVYLKHFLVLQHEEARTVALQRSAMELHEAVAQAEVALANEAQRVVAPPRHQKQQQKLLQTKQQRPRPPSTPPPSQQHQRQREKLSSTLNSPSPPPPPPSSTQLSNRRSKKPPPPPQFKQSTKATRLI